MTLVALGLGPTVVASCEALGVAGLVPARALVVLGHHATVATTEGELEVSVPPSLVTQAHERPVAGDYLAVNAAQRTVHSLLPRRSQLVRNAAGRATMPQVLAANVDVVFIVSSLDADFSVRRLERYLSIVRTSGARPVVLLTKAGKATEREAMLAAAQEVARDAPVCTIDVIDGLDADVPLLHFGEGETAALVGSSGVGKSTLANHLIGSFRADTGAVREDDAKGRHTTTRRELFFLPGGRALLDTPGLRELSLFDDEVGVRATFPEIAELAGQCRFRDCHHGREPGCAVTAAIASGELSAGRWASFRALLDEALARKAGPAPERRIGGRPREPSRKKRR
jgi:ribosome biogenesis GTPase